MYFPWVQALGRTKKSFCNWRTNKVYIIFIKLLPAAFHEIKLHLYPGKMTSSQNPNVIAQDWIFKVFPVASIFLYIETVYSGKPSQAPWIWSQGFWALCSKFERYCRSCSISSSQGRPKFFRRILSSKSSKPFCCAWLVWKAPNNKSLFLHASKQCMA